MPTPRLALSRLDLREGRIRTLHLAWFAFFLTFVIWFNHAPGSARPSRIR